MLASADGPCGCSQHDPGQVRRPELEWSEKDRGWRRTRACSVAENTGSSQSTVGRQTKQRSDTTWPGISWCIQCEVSKERGEVKTAGIFGWSSWKDGGASTAVGAPCGRPAVQCGHGMPAPPVKESQEVVPRKQWIWELPIPKRGLVWRSRCWHRLSLEPLGWRRSRILGPSEVRGTKRKRSTQERKLKRKNQLGRKKTKILGARGRESFRGQTLLPGEMPGGNGPGWAWAVHGGGSSKSLFLKWEKGRAAQDHFCLREVQCLSMNKPHPAALAGKRKYQV